MKTVRCKKIDKVVVVVVVVVLLFYVQVNSYGHGGRSVHVTTLFPGQLTSNSCIYFRL